MITLAVAQVLLDCPKERRFLRFAKRRLGHLFPYITGQSGYNKRVRELAGEIVAVLGCLARISPSWCDNLRLVDATPVPCGASRETVRRSEFAGYAAYGWCAAHSRHFWGFKLFLLAAPDGMPIAFELAPANVPEREVVAEMLAGIDLEGYTVIGDKGLSGAEIEGLVACLGGCLPAPRPSRRGAAVRQPRRRPSMDRGDHRPVQGPALARAPRRPHDALGSAPASRSDCWRWVAVVWHNWRLWEAGELESPIRSLVAYDH